MLNKGKVEALALVDKSKDAYYKFQSKIGLAVLALTGALASTPLGAFASASNNAKSVGNVTVKYSSHGAKLGRGITRGGSASGVLGKFHNLIVFIWSILVILSVAMLMFNIFRLHGAGENPQAQIVAKKGIVASIIVIALIGFIGPLTGFALGFL